MNEIGFYWKGNLIKEDKEIYKKFKEWVDYAHNQMMIEIDKK